MKTQDKCPICGGDLCYKESHIIPVMYYNPIWKRYKENIRGFDNKQGATIYFGNENNLNREGSELHYTNREEHPHKLAEKYLICCKCEDKFGKIETECTKVLQDLRIPTNQGIVTLENRKANIFYNLIFSMIYRISICRYSDLSYFNFSNDNQQNIIKIFVNNAFENKLTDLISSNVGLLVCRYNTILERDIDTELEREVDTDESVEVVGGGDGFLFHAFKVTDNQYIFVILDLVFMLYFDINYLNIELQKHINTDFNNIKIRVLDEDAWENFIKPIKIMFAKEMLRFENNNL